MQEMLEKVGKKLKKNNVSVDVISFGDCAEENKEKLEAFVAAVTKDESSHYVEVPLGSNLSDFLLGSPVVSHGYADSGGAGGGGGAGAAAGAIHAMPTTHASATADQLLREPIVDTNGV